MRQGGWARFMGRSSQPNFRFQVLAQLFCRVNIGKTYPYFSISITLRIYFAKLVEENFNRIRIRGNRQ